MPDTNEIIDDVEKLVNYILGDKPTQRLTGANANKPEDALGNPSCEHCKALQSMLQAGDSARRVCRKGKDSEAIEHLQYHLVNFGYDLGSSGPNNDGVDGDYGGGTVKALAAFLKEVVPPIESDGGSLTKDGAKAVLKAHQAGFKTKMSGVVQKTKLPGGLDRLIEVWKYLHGINDGGFINGGVLVKLPGVSKKVLNGTNCDDFTAAVIGVAFDPQFDPASPRPIGEEWVPMYDNGSTKLPFKDFYEIHNTQNKPVEAIIDHRYRLGYAVKPSQMQRGDLLGIDWYGENGDNKGGGHAGFCWDVHTVDGKVDCFQLFASNGSLKKKPPPSNKDKGVSVSGMTRAETVFLAGATDEGTVEKGTWFGLPPPAPEIPELGTDARKKWESTFPVTPKNVKPAASEDYSVGLIKAGRFFLEDDQPTEEDRALQRRLDDQTGE